MKISSFYLTDISDADSFVDMITNDISEMFYNKGCSPLSIEKFISYLRLKLTGYASIIYGKDTNIILLLPRKDRKLIEKEIDNKKERIIIRLNYDKVKSILNGDYEEFRNYIEEIIIDLKDNLSETKDMKFNEYLINHLQVLASVCASELQLKLDNQTLKKYLVKRYGWLRLSKLSTIFEDYYKLFKEDKEQNAKIFCTFIQSILNYIIKEEN